MSSEAKGKVKVHFYEKKPGIYLDSKNIVITLQIVQDH